MYCVVTPTVQRSGKLEFAQHQLLHLYTGFRSVYAFAARERDLLLSQQHMRRITHLPVIAIELLVDFDDHVDEAYAFRQLLDDRAIMYNMYDSGNRSVHFHIATTRQEGAWVPYAQREWVRQTAPAADLTVYRHTGLFRLPYTWHEKNPGHRKKLIVAQRGAMLDIPRLEPKLVSVPVTAIGAADAQAKLAYGLRKHQVAGGRRVHAWFLGAMAYDAGLGLDEAINMVLEWSQGYSYPVLDPDVVVTKVEEAFSSRELTNKGV